MNFQRIPFLHSGLKAAALLALALGMQLSAHAQASAADQPNPPLPAVRIQAGIHMILAEVAAEPGTQAKGLMFRTKLGINQGMLFVFNRKAQSCFWMRNTLLPLSIAFIDDDGTIVNIEDMAPKTEDSHCPLKAIRYALEMEQGWFAKKGILPGSRLINKDIFQPAKP